MNEPRPRTSNGLLMKVLFTNRPAASAGQFNSAQAGAALSIITWMLSSSREMEEIELHIFSLIKDR